MHFRFLTTKASLAVFKPSPDESSVIAVKLKIKSRLFLAANLCLFFSTKLSLGNTVMFYFSLSSCNKARFQDHTFVLF